MGRTNRGWALDDSPKIAHPAESKQLGLHGAIPDENALDIANLDVAHICLVVAEHLVVSDRRRQKGSDVLITTPSLMPGALTQVAVPRAQRPPFPRDTPPRNEVPRDAAVTMSTASAVPVYFELSWSILSSIGVANVLFGILVVGITTLSPIAAVPIVTSVAGAIANGLCYYAFYDESNSVKSQAVASGFADLMWMVRELPKSLRLCFETIPRK